MTTTYREYTRRNKKQHIDIANMSWITDTEADYEAIAKSFKDEWELWKYRLNPGFNKRYERESGPGKKEQRLVTESWDDTYECWVQNVKIVKIVEE